LAAEGVLVAALEDGTGVVSEERMQGRDAHEISMVVGGKSKMATRKSEFGGYNKRQ
jgi:hypothetical protein